MDTDAETDAEADAETETAEMTNMETTDLLHWQKVMALVDAAFPGGFLVEEATV